MQLRGSDRQDQQDRAELALRLPQLPSGRGAKLAASLYTTARKRGLSGGALKALMRLRCGVSSTTKLTLAQYNDMRDVVLELDPVPESQQADVAPSRRVAVDWSRVLGGCSVSLAGAIALLSRYPRGWVVAQLCLAVERKLLAETDEGRAYRATEAALKRHHALDAYREYMMSSSAKSSRQQYERDLQQQVAA